MEMPTESMVPTVALDCGHEIATNELPCRCPECGETMCEECFDALDDGICETCAQYDDEDFEDYDAEMFEDDSNGLEEEEDA